MLNTSTELKMVVMKPHSLVVQGLIVDDQNLALSLLWADRGHIALLIGKVGS